METDVLAGFPQETRGHRIRQEEDDRVSVQIEDSLEEETEGSDSHLVHVLLQKSPRVKLEDTLDLEN